MSKTTSAELLCAILSSREHLIRGAAFAEIDRLNPLVSAGILVPAGHVASVFCLECASPHCAEVESVEGRIGWYCHEVGLVAAAPASVAAFEVRPEVLALRLHDALGGKKAPVGWPSKRPLLWDLGLFESHRFAVAVYLVPNATDPEAFNELCRFLRTPRRHPDGVAVLTNDDRDTSAIFLPEGVRIVRLSEVATIATDGHITLDTLAIAKNVLPRRMLDPPRPGRKPVKREIVVQIIGDLDRQGKLADLSEREQQKLVHASLKDRLGDEATLAAATFRAALAVHRTGGL